MFITQVINVSRCKSCMLNVGILCLYLMYLFVADCLSINARRRTYGAQSLTVVATATTAHIIRAHGSDLYLGN
jgi:hypothetical protein